MKTSNKILFAAGAAPFACLFILAVMLKVIPFEAKITETVRVEETSWPSRTFSLAEFQSISSKGAWDIRLVQADDYSIEITAPENVLNNITVEIKSQTLFLESNNKAKNSLNPFEIKAHIRLPYVSEIAMQGASSLYLSEMAVDYIAINTQGLLKVSGTASSIQNLSLVCQGLSKIDLLGTSVTNANMRCGGLFSVDLLMNGGRLIGMLDGIGTLSYEGDVSDDNIISNSPFVKVVHR